MNTKKNLKKKIIPRASEKYGYLRMILNIMSLFIMVASIYMIYLAAKDDHWIIIFIGIFIFYRVFFSFLSLNPYLHNKLRSKKKVIPIENKKNLPDFFNLILNTNTPYGGIKLQKLQNSNLILPSIILDQEKCQIYFYVKKNELVLKLIAFDPQGYKSLNGDRALNFLQEVTDYFCFIQNERTYPSEAEYREIFKKSLKN